MVLKCKDLQEPLSSRQEADEHTKRLLKGIRLSAFWDMKLSALSGETTFWELGSCSHSPVRKNHLFQPRQKTILWHFKIVLRKLLVVWEKVITSCLSRPSKEISPHTKTTTTTTKPKPEKIILKNQNQPTKETKTPKNQNKTKNQGETKKSPNQSTEQLVKSDDYNLKN